MQPQEPSAASQGKGRWIARELPFVFATGYTGLLAYVAVALRCPWCGAGLTARQTAGTWLALVAWWLTLGVIRRRLGYRRGSRSDWNNMIPGAIPACVVVVVTRVIFNMDHGLALSPAHLKIAAYSVTIANAGDELQGETAAQEVSPGGKAVFVVRMQPVLIPKLTASGDGGSKEWTVRYYDSEKGGKDITGQVTKEGVTVTGDRTLRLEIIPAPSLSPGTSKTITLKVIGTEKTTTLTATVTVAKSEESKPKRGP